MGKLLHAGIVGALDLALTPYAWAWSHVVERMAPDLSSDPVVARLVAALDVDEHADHAA